VGPSTLLAQILRMLRVMAIASFAFGSSDSGARLFFTAPRIRSEILFLCSFCGSSLNHLRIIHDNKVRTIIIKVNTTQRASTTGRKNPDSVAKSTMLTLNLSLFPFPTRPQVKAPLQSLFRSNHEYVATVQNE